jgi:hypothetical protein
MEQIHDQVHHQLLDATGFRWQGKSRAPFKEDTYEKLQRMSLSGFSINAVLLIFRGG